MPSAQQVCSPTENGSKLSTLAPFLFDSTLLEHAPACLPACRYIRCARREEDVNLLRVAVHTVNQDPTAPVLALFACANIAKGNELVRS